jgi:hypothetical protein
MIYMYLLIQSNLHPIYTYIHNIVHEFNFHA